MNKLLLSTKGENSSIKLGFIFLGIFGIICSVIAFMIFADMPSYATNDSTEMMGIVACAGSFAFALVAFLFAFYRCNTYIDIYEDHTEGKALQGKGINNIFLSNDQIKSVTRESYYLCLHTHFGIYKIICNKETSEKVMRYFNQKSVFSTK